MMLSEERVGRSEEEESVNKTCMVQLSLFALVVVVLAFSIKKFTSSRNVGEMQALATVAASEAPPAPPTGATLPAFGLHAQAANPGVATPSPLPTPTPTATPSCRGIEGLSLVLARPLLTFEADEIVQGFAVDPQFQYVCVRGGERRETFIFKYHRHDGSIAQVRQLPHEADHAVEALWAGADVLWVSLCHLTEDRGVMVAVDRDDLDIRRALPVTERIVALAQGVDGHVYGVSDEAAVFYTWSREGVLLRRWSVGGGARYVDMDVVRGALVCVGTDAEGGVIDVIDPGTTSLLSRHRYCVPMPGHGQAQFSGLGYADETFYLLTRKADVPLVMSYELADIPLSLYVPSVVVGS